MKSWVSSAFECDKAAKPKHLSETFAKVSVSGQQNSHKLPIGKNVPGHSTKKPLANADLQLCDKYEPKNRGELMVNKTKIEELSNFIDKHNQKSAILLLQGITQFSFSQF
jgi:hypothetical protein